ncbi:MAG: (deoxy)nucleoside triphosphate pyrophosphohydrolase [Saccharofermentanales bacterium]
MIHKIEVVAAIILYKDEILCMQRDVSKYDYLSYKYEFPGGKMETGESCIQALKRELQEEMDFDADISEDDYFLTVEYRYPDFEIVMHSFLCNSKTKDFVLKEHRDFRWLKQNELLSLKWAQADLPVVEKLISYKIEPGSFWEV